MRAADGVVTPPVVPRAARAAAISYPNAIMRQAYFPARISFTYPAIRETYFSLYARAIRARSTRAEPHANATRANLAPQNSKALECAVMRFLVRVMSVSPSK